MGKWVQFDRDSHPLSGTTDKRVSVCMPWRNRLREFKIASVSLLAQRPHEIVIVDDGSFDGSGQWLTTVFRDRCEELGIDLVYHRLADSGYKRYPLDAFNLCMSLATGEILIQQSPEVLHINHVIGSLVISVAYPTVQDGEAANEHIAFARVVDAPLLWAASLAPFGSWKRILTAHALSGEPWDERDACLKQHELLTLPPPAPAPYYDGGKGIRLYIGKERPLPFFFCGAITKKLWTELGGYDAVAEYNRDWGADAEFANRLLHRGTRIHGSATCLACHIRHGRE